MSLCIFVPHKTHILSRARGTFTAIVQATKEAKNKHNIGYVL